MIAVRGPIVEIDGDEMARVLWRLVRDRLVRPFLDLDIRYFDLSLSRREATADEVTLDAARAIRQHQVGVKCATVTPDRARTARDGLTRSWPSPNGTIRNVLGGVVFREPVVIPSVPRRVPGWTKPIVIGRHAHADQYRSTNFTVPGPGRLTLTFTPDDGTDPIEHVVADYPDDGGVAMGMYNFTRSIEDFARASLSYGRRRRMPVYLSTKDTVLKSYDGAFRDIFQRVFDSEFAADFAELGLTYEHRLIDDMVASAMKWDGGYVWACKNYDGDVQCDSIAQGFGSPGLMTSVLSTPDGQTIEAEAAHGTIARHYARYLTGEPAEANPIACIYAWSTALAHRGALDDAEPVRRFAGRLEAAAIGTVEAGCMTKDLAALRGPDQDSVGTVEFIDAVADELTRSLT